MGQGFPFLEMGLIDKFIFKRGIFCYLESEAD